MAFEMFFEFVNPVSTPAGTVRVMGESVDKAHPNAIELTGVSFGVENSTTIGSATGGAGSGKAKFEEIKITKRIDSTTPYLYSLVGTGGSFSEAALFIRRSGAPNDHLVYRFRMVFVTNINWSAESGDDAPTETLKLQYGSMQLNYTPQSPTGGQERQITTVWNQVTNTPTFDVPGGN